MPDVMAVATENEDGSYTVVCFNQGDTPRSVHIEGLPTTSASSWTPKPFKRLSSPLTNL